MVDLSNKTAQNGYSPTENVGSGMTQGKLPSQSFTTLQVQRKFPAMRTNQITLI